MIRFSKLAAAIAVVSVLAIGGKALADSPGQLGSGPFVYRVKNVTTNGSYASTANASACDVVQYTTELNNGGFGGLTNIIVKATLPATSSTSVASTVTATPDQGASFGTTGTATVNFSTNQSLSYVSGSTQLVDFNGNLIKNLPDTITTSGVNVGDLLGSTTEFVHLQAKVNCPTPPVVSFACTALDVTKIDRTHYDFTANGSAQNATISGFTFTLKDANSKVVDTNTASTSATSAVYHFNQEAGTYTVSAQVNTDHGNISSSACVKQITVASVPTTPTTPTVKTLPNTGAGDVLGIFTGASSLGAVGHYVVSRRKRSL